MNATTVTELAVNLCMGLAVRCVSDTPMLADPIAISAGRLHLWSTWAELPEERKRMLARLLRYRPVGLAQPKAFLAEAAALLERPFSPYQLASGETAPVHFRTRFTLRKPVNLDEHIALLAHELEEHTKSARTVNLPKQGPLSLVSWHDKAWRNYEIPCEARERLPPYHFRLRIDPAARQDTLTWDTQTLLSIADRLDACGYLHSSHRISLLNILRDASSLKVAAGKGYRVNAPTGSGKTVFLRLLALASAIQGGKVTIVVPYLTDIDHTVDALRTSADVLGRQLRVARLHSQGKIGERFAIHFGNRNEDHPYDYSCLLNQYATDEKIIPGDDEPCFRLRLRDHGEENKPGRETKLPHCPFLFSCGKATMISDALAADIVVVNHHALLSGVTRVPMENDERRPRTTLLEILLKRSHYLLIDEVDGLLDAAISSSVVELKLGSGVAGNKLSELFQNMLALPGPIPDMTRAHANRARYALVHTTVTVKQLLDLHDAGYLSWPRQPSTWPTAADDVLQKKLQVDLATLDALFETGAAAPEHLRALQRNLVFWASSSGQRSAEEMAIELSNELESLQKQKILFERMRPAERGNLKSALILRGLLQLIEDSLRNLQIDLPTLVRANVHPAEQVEQEMRGKEPITLTPNGPLHHTVYGFTRQQQGPDDSALVTLAMRGDPHRTLLFLPGATSLAYAGVERAVVGFSATAYFPGASGFDLPALDLIDIADQPGKINFVNIPTTTSVSGRPMHERPTQVRSLALELWPWIQARLAQLASHKETARRARLLLITTSDADALEFAKTLLGITDGPAESVGLVRGARAPEALQGFPVDQVLEYSDLETFSQGPHAHRSILIGSLNPMARGHNIVNPDSVSAIGGIVICVRPLPSSNRPAAVLGHICYETNNVIAPSPSIGENLLAEQRYANRMLYAIRKSSLAFSLLPSNIRHYTIMNILVLLLQLLGRARRGGTAVTCYLADAAFVSAGTSWSSLLSDALAKLKQEGHLEKFTLHHAALVDAIQRYIADNPEVRHEKPPVAH